MCLQFLFVLLLWSMLPALHAYPPLQHAFPWTDRPAIGRYEYAYGVSDEAGPRINYATAGNLHPKPYAVVSAPINYAQVFSYASHPVAAYSMHNGGIHLTQRLMADGYGLYSGSMEREYDPKWEEGWRLLRHDDGVKYEGEWFSEEGSGLSRILPYPICGMKCSGHLCDNKLPIFVMPNRRAPLYSHVATWTAWTSDKDAEFHGLSHVAHCPKGQFVIQIQCWGAFCKSLRLGCSKLRSEFRAQYEIGRYDNAKSDDTNLNTPFSNEAGGTGYCPDGEYLDGIQCSSWFCNYIRLFCSRIQIATMS